MNLLYILLICAVSASAQRLGIFYVDNTMIPVGRQDAVVHTFSLPADALLRWNRQDRTVERSDRGSAVVKLLPEDTANSGLGELTIVEPLTGSILATAWIPVGFNVLARDLLYDRPRKRCYLTTPQQPGDSRFAAESLVAMNPETGEILQTVLLGGGPAQMALTTDGTTLYVVLEAGGVVKRLDAETLAVSSEFTFRSAGASPGYAKVGLATLPGTRSTLGLYYAPNTGSSLHTLAIFDNGIKRANEVDTGDGADSVIFSPDGRYLFLAAFSRVNGPKAVSRFNVDASGLPDKNYVQALGGGPVEFVGDLLYTSGGTAINYKTMVVERSIGVGGAQSVDVERARILTTYFLSSRTSGEYPQYLQAFDLDTQTPLGWINLGSVNYVAAGVSPVQRLIRFGTDGLIFTDSRGLLMFHTPLAGPAPALNANGVRNSRGEVITSLRPGETLTLSGENLGPVSGLDAGQIMQATSLGGVRVWFNSVPGVLTSVSRNEVKVKVPANGLSAGSTVWLQVWYFGLPSRRLPLVVQE